MYRPLPEFLTIKSSNIHGLGLYTEKCIPENYVLGITHVRDERFENGFIRTPLGGCFNDAEAPNCKVVPLGDYLMLVSLSSIPSGSEITAKYTMYNPKV